MINLHNPFRSWESEHGKHNWFGLGSIAEGVAYGIANEFSWRHADKIPEAQANANAIVIKKQQESYDAISLQQRDIIKAALGMGEGNDNGYLDNINSILDGELFEDAYPDVAKAAAYIPVDACCVQGDTIECNITHTDRADDYVRYVNRLHEQNDLIHLLSMCPDFLVNMDIMNKAVQYLMRGILPTGDVIDILTDNAEAAALSGRIGSSRKTTARDLGISKLRVQAAGRREFREMTAWMNSAVSPIQRQHDITEMMINPGDRINLALTQAQLIQNSLQNKNNQLAQKEPFKLAKLQLRLQRIVTKLQTRMSEALLVNTYVPNAALTTPTGIGADPGQRLAGLGQAMSSIADGKLMGKIGDNIPPAMKSWYYGSPGTQSGAQPGFSQGSITGGHNASDRPF